MLLGSIPDALKKKKKRRKRERKTNGESVSFLGLKLWSQKQPHQHHRERFRNVNSQVPRPAESGTLGLRSGQPVYETPLRLRASGLQAGDPSRVGSQSLRDRREQKMEAQ